MSNYNTLQLSIVLHKTKVDSNLSVRDFGHLVNSNFLEHWEVVVTIAMFVHS